MKIATKKAAIGFIFVTLLIDITGWGIILPVVPKLIQELIHADISEAATYGGWLLSSCDRHLHKMRGDNN